MSPATGDLASQTYDPPQESLATPFNTGRTTILPSGDGPTRGAAPTEHAPRFESLGELGMGGLGQVLVAHDLDIGRKVAIKRMREDRRGPSEQLRFVREVRTVGALEHPNIVTIHDVGREADGGLYFVMNYIDGETMEAILDRLKAGDAQTHAQWPFSRRLHLFHQLLHALGFAHAHGVLHRDIKPANIMIGRHGQVQLVDWGIAKHLEPIEPAPVDRPPQLGPASGAETLVPEGLESGGLESGGLESGDLESGGLESGTLIPSDPRARATRDSAHTRAGSLIGTPRYMAPEQARGEPFDVRSETYTLSLVLYEWLTLLHPFDGLESVDEILAAARERSVSFPLQPHPHQARPPADMLWFVMDGLGRDPNQRYQSVQEMIERLDARNEGEIPEQCVATSQKRLLHRFDQLIDRSALLSAVALAAAGGLMLAGVLAIFAAFAALGALGVGMIGSVVALGS